MSKKPKKLVLIDANAIIHRAYHALPPLTTKTGELVNAVYGFSNILLKTINELKPDYILAAFDLRGKTFRHEEYKDYKATRVKAPEELYEQIDRVKDVLKVFNIPIYEKEGFEADDIIGTLKSQAEKNPPAGGKIENIIVTGDLDALQLVSPKTKVYALRKGMSDTIIYDEAAVKDRYELSPEQLIDYKGLRGDPSDNIPGVKGVGEKTAIDLVKKYKSIEEIYKSIGEIKGAVGEKLEKDKMNAVLSKKLATIVKNVPVKLNLENSKTHEFDRKSILDLFQELNFFSLIKRLPESKEVHPVKSSPGEVSEAEFSGVKDYKFKLIKETELDEFMDLLKKQKEIAIYLRTTGDKYYNSELQGIAISYKTGRAGYVAFGESKSQKLKIKSILEDENIKKISYDLKYCMEVLKENDINLSEPLYDIMLAAYALNPGGGVEFKNLVLEELGEEITVTDKKGQLGLEMDSEKDIANKICQASDYVWKLKKIYSEKLADVSKKQKGKNVKSVFDEIEMPLVEVLSQMELNGIKFNPIIFKGISKKISETINGLEKSIHKYAKQQFNVNSPQQLAEVLFVKLKLPTEEIKKNKTGYSTASPELGKLRGKHKIIEKIEEYRELFKLKTTYLDALPDLVQEDSRLHTTFNQEVTATGRLSSSDPNLQNIPIRTDLGKFVRTAFEAERDWRLVSADYSQIDLRVVAHVSEDKKLIETFIKGEDIHRATAAEVFKITPSQVTEKMRRNAKALNFGIIYGMSVFGFAQSAGIERDEAKVFINDYMKKFPAVADYIRKTKNFAKKNGYVETELGRRRYIPEINSPNFQVQNAGERMAINMPIQGLAADIMKLAMIKVYAEFKNDPHVRMVLQVHDEIILEAKESVANKVSEKIKRIMEGVYKLKVPLVVNVKIGDNWGEI